MSHRYSRANDPSRSIALVAYCPGSTLPYYSWTAGQWVSALTSACLLPLAPDPASACRDVAVARIPANLNYQAVVLQAMALNASGNPVETLYCETITPS